MGLFEVYATTSIALAVAIPTFFEKVMRPGYEKRVEKFRQESLEEFRQALNEFVDIFNIKNELTEEIIEKMEYVVESWGKVQINDKKFEQLINLRNLVTLSWFFIFSWTILSIHSLEISNILNFDWPKYVTFIFFSGIVITFSFVYSLLQFDKELVKFDAEEEKSKEIKKRPTRIFGNRYNIRNQQLEAESQIMNALKNSNIPFERDVSEKNYHYDIVIPNLKKPKVFVEIKVFLDTRNYFSPMMLDRLVRMSVFSKRDYPQSKFVVFTNNKDDFITSRAGKLLKFDVDKTFDLKEINEFIKFIKNELE